MPVKLPTIRPIAPQWKTATKSTVAATVMQDVRDARDRERDGALLDAEERRQLLVVRLRPEPDGAGDDEVRGVVPSPSTVRDRRRRRSTPSSEPERRRSHREPERRADDGQLLRLVLRVEVEAEERARDAELEHDREHRRRRGDDLDLAVRARREVVRVQRQQEHREDARHHPAEPVDGGVAAEPLQLVAELHLQPSVEVDQAGGDGVGVVDPLDVGAARRADAAALLRRLDERAQRVRERLLRRADDRHLDAERLLGARDRLVVEERDHRLAERHRLDREDAVPAGVQLVDDDVGVAVALERLAVVEPFDDLELDVELLARGDDVLRSLARCATTARAARPAARGPTAAPARSR